MSGDKFEVEDDFLTIGRTFTEYRRMFDLDAAELVGRSVLDCGAGVGSFAATAAELGADVTAVDPLYDRDREALAEECAAAVEYNLKGLREQRDAFVWDFYGDVETRGHYLRAAYNRFLADYGTHPERYVTGELPDLPFDDDAADLALCANVLFVYDDRLDRAFHEAALRELARVAREEVRVFPLHSLDRSRSAFVDPLVDSLREEGHAAELRGVPYEFQPGATEMLVVS